jgi:hypothetical protein
MTQKYALMYGLLMGVIPKRRRDLRPHQIAAGPRAVEQGSLRLLDPRQKRYLIPALVFAVLEQEKYY